MKKKASYVLPSSVDKPQNPKTPVDEKFMMKIQK